MRGSRWLPLVSLVVSCGDDDLPPSRGKGDPSELPPLWGFGVSSGQRQRDLACGDAFFAARQCEPSLDRDQWALFCNSKSINCLQCLADVPCDDSPPCKDKCQESPFPGSF